MTSEQILHAVLTVGVIALVTFLLRVLPFLIFGGKRRPPAFIGWLSSVLPFAVMGMLVVYCFKGISFTAAPFAIPELAATVLVVLLHVWRRNALLSIGGGTAAYMLLLMLF